MNDRDQNSWGGVASYEAVGMHTAFSVAAKDVPARPQDTRGVRVALFMVACMAVMLFTAAAAYAQPKWRTLPSGYRVLQSGYTLVQQTSDRMYWIDEDRVIFVGYSPQQAALFRKERLTPALFIWNVRTGVTTTHMKLGERAGALCFADGFLTVRTEMAAEGGPAVVMAGPLGKETLKVYEKGVPRWGWDRSSAGAFGFVSNPYTCTLQELTPDEPFARGKQRVVFPLLPEHGAIWLEGGEPASDFLRLYRSSDRRWVDLPIKRDKRGLRRVPYVRWSGQYVIDEHRDTAVPRSERAKLWPIHLLQADGSVKTVSLPLVDEIRSGFEPPVFARTGVFVEAGHLTSRPPGTAGVYRLGPRGWSRIVEGETEGSSLSPDGCWYALGVNAKRVGELSRVTVIDLCSGDKS